MHISATDAKNRFGQLLEQCQREPVTIEKSGRRHSVLLSVQDYDALVARVASEPKGKNTAKLFYEQYKEWVDMHNEIVETHGVFGAEHRPW